jgi:hypothetical protein
VRRYFVVLDGLRQDPQASLRDLATVATSIQLSSQRRLLRSERRNGYRQVGTTSVADLSVEAVNLSNSDPSTGQVPTVAIDVCWDVNGADLVDKDGQSVVSPTRATTGWTRYTVANYKWAEQPIEGWRIATSEDLEKEPCAGS